MRQSQDGSSSFAGGAFRQNVVTQGALYIHIVRHLGFHRWLVKLAAQTSIPTLVGEVWGG